MSLFWRGFCLCAALLFHTAFATEASSLSALDRRSINNGVPLKIMPLGASIVWGTDSTDGNGFRLHLRNLLEQGGNNVSYVGTVFHGNMSNNACEAYPGRTISEVDRLAQKSKSYRYKPNVFLVHLGTNDCMAVANESSATAADNFGSLLATIKQQDADALVLASTLIHNLTPDVDRCITNFNARLPAIVQTAMAGGQKVTLVDMHDVVPRSDINTTDNTHPTDAGYGIMAHVWHKGLMNASALITPPDGKGKAAPTTRSSATTSPHLNSALALLVALTALWIFLP